MTENKIEAWLKEIQARCENRDNKVISKTTEELMSTLLALVRVYRDANRYALQEYWDRTEDAMRDVAKAAEEKAKEIIG